MNNHLKDLLLKNDVGLCNKTKIQLIQYFYKIGIIISNMLE